LQVVQDDLADLAQDGQLLICRSVSKRKDLKHETLQAGHLRQGSK
jgi:hypothetical protein